MAAPFETLASGYHSLEAPSDQRLSIAISGNDVVSRLNDGSIFKILTVSIMLLQIGIPEEFDYLESEE